MKKQILKTLKTHLDELENCYMLDVTSEEIASVKAQIAYLEREIMKDAQNEYIGQLREFKKYMNDTFDDACGDGCTSETVTDFYNSDFVITWRNKSVKIYMGAEEFQSIEQLIDFEIEEYEV